MPRNLRLRIVAGLMAGFGGVVFAVMAPAIAMLLLMEQPSPDDLEQRLPELMTTIENAGRTAALLGFVGWAITAVAAAYTLTTWARWFLRNQTGPKQFVET